MRIEPKLLVFQNSPLLAKVSSLFQSIQQSHRCCSSIGCPKMATTSLDTAAENESGLPDTSTACAQALAIPHILKSII